MVNPMIEHNNSLNFKLTYLFCSFIHKNNLLNINNYYKYYPTSENNKLINYLNRLCFKHTYILKIYTVKYILCCR